MPYIAFGFDNAGAGFDQRPFISDLNIQIAAVGVSPAAVGVAQVHVKTLRVAAVGVSPPAIGVAQVLQYIPVREQAVDLGAWGFSGFTGAILIEPDLIVGRATAYLRQVDWASGNGVSIQLASTTTGPPFDTGPEFISDVEDYSLAFTFEDSAGGSVVIGGPNDPDNSSQDRTEPYFWVPGNASAWFTWYNQAFSNGYDVTLTIRAVPAPTPSRLDLAAFADSPSATALSAVQVQPAERRPITGLATSPTSNGVVRAQVRPVLRHPLHVAAAPPSSDALVEVHTREPERRRIDALASSPTTTGVAAVHVRAVQRHPIAVLASSPASNGLGQAFVRAVDRHEISALAAPVASLPMPPWTTNGIFRNVRSRIPGDVNRLVIIDRGGGVYQARAFADGTAWQADYPGVTWQTVGTPGNDGQRWDASITAAQYDQIFATGRLSVTFITATGFAQLLLRATNRHQVNALAASPTGASFAQAQVLATEQHTVNAITESPTATSGVQVNVRTVDRHPVASLATSPIPASFANVLTRDVQRHTVTALATSLQPASFVVVLTRNVARYPVAAQSISTGSVGTTQVLHRATERFPIRSVVLSPPTASLASVQIRRVDRHEVRAESVSPVATPLAIVQTRRVPRVPVRGIATSPSSTTLLSVQRRGVDRVSLTAQTISLPSVPLVRVRVRDVARHPITTQALSPPVTSFTSIQTQRVNRHAIRAFFPTLPLPKRPFGFDGVGSGFDQSPFTPSVASDAAVAFAQVRLRDTPRHDVRAQVVSPGSVGFANVILIERHAIRPQATSPPATGIAQVKSRLASRHLIWVQVSSPSATGAVRVQKRSVMEKAVSAFGLSPGSIGITEALKRVAAERPVMTFALSPSAVSLATVQIRTVMEKAVAANATSPAAVGLAATLKRFAAERPVMTVAVSPGSVALAMVQRRTIIEIAVAAFVSSPNAVALAEVLKTVSSRHPLMVAPARSPVAITFTEMLPREPRDVALLGLGVSPPQQSLVIMLHRGAPGKAIRAFGTSPTGLSFSQVLKGAAMPPGMVTNVILILAGYNFLHIGWMQPADLGTGVLTNYEFQVDGGPRMSTMSPSPEFTIDGLMPATSYTIAVRAQTTVGRGPASPALTVSTLSTTVPTVPLYPSVASPGGGVVDFTWVAPASNGGADITSYEVAVINPDNMEEPAESTGGPATTHRVRGLQFFQRYGFKVRGVNSVGAGPYTDVVHATPVPAAVRVRKTSQRLPLLDLDRQSLIVRLAGTDCRVKVYFQPSDNAWYSDIEVPVNTPLVRGKRIAVGAGLLDRLPSALPGNVVCRPVDEDSASTDPKRDAWERGTHGLYWEAN